MARGVASVSGSCAGVRFLNAPFVRGLEKVLKPRVLEGVGGSDAFFRDITEHLVQEIKELIDITDLFVGPAERFLRIFWNLLAKYVEFSLGRRPDFLKNREELITL